MSNLSEGQVLLSIVQDSVVLLSPKYVSTFRCKGESDIL